ncbi:hypothetical protein protein [Bacillus cereus G9241]|nr:hypothetical protein protein [Bacillus cereus G9241]
MLEQSFGKTNIQGVKREVAYFLERVQCIDF